MKRLAVAAILLLGIGYAANQGYAWVNYQVNTPVSSASEPVKFKVTTGESPGQIGSDLLQAGLIRNLDVWNYYLRYTGDRSRLQAGDYVLNRDMSLAQIADALQNGHPDQVSVTMPEGYTEKLMAAAAQKAGIGTAADYLSLSKDPVWTYDFLASRPHGEDLEGYLFPETYSLNKGATSRDLVKAQLDEFGSRFTPALRTEAAAASAARPGQTVESIVILASMVEREVDRDPDRAIVCGIYYNRLKIKMPLQVDATVLYAMGIWKGSVTLDDLKFESPYNTYLHTGLPPGPIANPGLAAIKSCVEPQQTDFFYYFTDPGGVTHFDKTLADFNRDQQKYGVAGT